MYKFAYHNARKIEISYFSKLCKYKKNIRRIHTIFTLFIIFFLSFQTNARYFFINKWDAKERHKARLKNQFCYLSDYCVTARRYAYRVYFFRARKQRAILYYVIMVLTLKVLFHNRDQSETKLSAQRRRLLLYCRCVWWQTSGECHSHSSSGRFAI